MTEPLEAPVRPALVLYNGRWMLPVIGGSDETEVQDQPDIEADGPTEVDQPNAPDNPDYFSDKFDPATLPDELRPAYQQLRGDYTRKTQEVGRRNRDQILQQALQDQEFQRQAFEAWGVELPQEDYDDDDLYDDPTDDLRRELAELKQWRDEFTQAQTKREQEQAVTSSIDRQIDSLEGRLGRELPEQVANWIGNFAAQNPSDDGQPDVDGAYEAWVEAVKEDAKAQAKVKRRARTAPSGQSGSKQVNLNNDQERLKALADAFEEAELQGD